MTMSLRARFSLVVPSLVAVTIGLIAIFAPELFGSPAWHALRGLLNAFTPDDTVTQTPLQCWGVLWIIVAILCGLPAVTGSANAARVGLVASILMTSWLVSSFVAAFAIGERVGAVGIALGCGYIGFHIVMCAQPLRVPLEDVVIRVEK